MTEILEKLKESGKLETIKSIDDFKKVAEELGYDTKQIEDMVDKYESLSDEDLEKIAGGIIQTHDIMLQKVSSGGITTSTIYKHARRTKVEKIV